MKGWIDLGYPALHRPKVELALSRSQVQRPNHYTTKPHKTGIKSETIVKNTSLVTILQLLIDNSNNYLQSSYNLNYSR